VKGPISPLSGNVFACEGAEGQSGGGRKSGLGGRGYEVQNRAVPDSADECISNGASNVPAHSLHCEIS